MHKRFTLFVVLTLAFATLLGAIAPGTRAASFERKLHTTLSVSDHSLPSEPELGSQLVVHSFHLQVIKKLPLVAIATRTESADVSFNDLSATEAESNYSAKRYLFFNYPSHHFW